MELSAEQIGKLYDQYGALVFRRCRSLTGNDEDAYDLMQESFVRLVVNANQLNGTASPLTWLYRVSTNLCLNRVRDSRSRAQKLAQPDPAASQLPGMGAFAGLDPELRRLVLTFLDRVDEQTRSIVVYYFVDELTLEEIAELVNLSVPTVRKRIQQFQGSAQRLLDADARYLSSWLMVGFLMETFVSGGLKL